MVVGVDLRAAQTCPDLGGPGMASEQLLAPAPGSGPQLLSGLRQAAR